MSEKKKNRNHRLSQREINELPGRELKAKRTRSSKTYALGNGLYQAVIYPEAVHYRNENGEWEDIDHTLRQENGCFCDHSGDLSTQFETGGRVVLTKGEHRLSWHILGASAVDAIPENANPIFPRHEAKHRIENKVVYGDIFPDVDFVCELKPTLFKDTLIYKNAAALRPVEFLIHTENLTLHQAASGTVVAMCGDDTIFRLPSPRVVDNTGEAIANSANAVLTKINDTDWVWTCRVSDEYARTATYPICLDPVVETKQTKAAMTMVYTSSLHPATNYTANGYSTRISNDDYSWGKCRTYLRFHDQSDVVGDNLTEEEIAEQIGLPPIDSSHYVTSATLCMRTTEACTSTAVYLNEVAEAWPTTPITHNNQPEIAPEPIEYYNAPSTAGNYLYFNITNLVRKWYNGANYGLMLETKAGNMVQLGAAGASYHKPYVTITYVSLAGLEGYIKQDVINCGRAGTAYVGLFNGNLVFSHQETDMNGNLMPVSISRYYNSCYHDVDAFHAGKGWKFSTQQTLHKETIDSTVYYVYMDGDGTRHYFKNENGEWSDLSGLELTMEISGDKATILDKADGKMTFDLPQNEFWVNGKECYDNVTWIDSIEDACGTTATFKHTLPATPEDSSMPMQFTLVRDGAGRSTAALMENSHIGAITAPSMPAVEYDYDGGNLSNITHVDGATTTYAYNAQGLLKKVTNPDGSSVELVYNADKPYRVKDVYMYGTDRKFCSGRHYEYGNCCTTVTELYPETEDTIGTGKSLHYHFNDAGNLVSVNDDLGYGYFAGYSDAAPQNHPDYVSKLQYAVNNYLKNHHFITVNDDWLVEKVGGTGECGYSSDNNYIGGRSYKLKKTNSGGYISTYQTVSLETGKNYTLSCQYNTLNEAELQLQIEMPHGTILKTGSAVKCTDRWNRTHLSFNVPKIGSTESKTYADVTVRIMAVGNPGTVWVDAAQLEDGMVPNRYNLLENGNFYMNESGCPQRWTAGVGSNNEECDGVTQEIEPGRPSELAGNVVCLYGKPGKTKIFDQTVPSIGSAGDTFVAGGWSWNHSRPRNDDTPTYYEMEILARPYVSSGVAQFQTVGRVQWSEEWSGWQFAAIPIVIPFRYTDIYVKLLYQDNLNKAQFSNLFLHREEFGNTYDYDDKGNVTSVKNLAALQSGAEYDAFDNLTSYHQPGRSETYTLDWGNTDAKKKQHLLRSTTTPLGIISRTKYDVDSSTSGKGLPVANYVENTSDNFYIAGKTEYTGNGNYVAKQIDARGKEVITETNTDKGTVTYVKDPKGQQVNYTYDDMKRVKTVETSVVKNNVVNTYKNEYTYTDDKLTRVAHNTTGNDCDVVYTFAYDTQNRRTSVNVGDQQLSRNEYNNTPGNTYGTLARTVFGNDDVVSYTYDEFKRMTEVKYGTNNSQKYSYEYDANGQVARVTNHELGRTVLSEHDLCNRPMRITHMSGNDHLYTGEVTYDVYNNLHSFEERVGAARTQYITNFAYDVENKPTTLSYGSTANRVVYAYDNLGRTASRTVTVGGRSYPTTYAYIAGGVAYDSNNASKSGTTGLIATINQTGGNFTYEYDDNGNIISVVQDGKTTTYEYDALGQLIRVNDPHDAESGAAGTTWMYKYDLGGNITAKKRFAYTAPSITIADDAVALETMTFAYTNAAWKDQLTVFNGKPISYDAIGNPLQVGENNDADKVTYTWEKGRQLASMSKPGTTASFKYNENGLRIQKTVNGVVTDYTLHGKNIVHMTQGSNNLHFFYDANNKPAIVEYNGTKYAYVHNLQGDIVAILDSDGTAVVQYKYDAWGKPISKTGSMASTLGTVQPFRYRGYVYDEETGLYYLRSRYYCTYKCRFISSDILVDSNVYAYCRNSTVVNVDDDGYACVCCFDENGNLNTFMSMAMGGGIGGFGNALGGYTIVDTVRNMDEEDWINEAKTVGLIALSLTSSGLIMKGAHLLGKALLAEAIAYGSGKIIGYGLYGTTVANGLGLSYAVDGALHSAVGKEADTPSIIDFAVDFTLEFLSVDVPVIVDFFITYIDESIDRDSIRPVCK